MKPAGGGFFRGGPKQRLQASARALSDGLPRVMAALEEAGASQWGIKLVDKKGRAKKTTFCLPLPWAFA